MSVALPPSGWVPIGRGLSSEVFSLDGNRISKLFHPKISDEMIEREASAARLAASLGIPTAAPMKEIRTAGLRALIYPRISGRPMLDEMRRKPLSTRRLLRGMTGLHRQIYSQRVNSLRSVKSVLETDIVYGPAPKQIQQAAVRHLATLDDGDSLLHGDFHIGNILVDGPRLTVIDWAKAAMGAPAADAVRAEMLMRFGDGPSDAITNVWRDWAARAYRQEIAMAEEQLAAWRPVVALAWLRARPAVRNAAFHAYLNRALASAGLPVLAD